jgi:hypothetical protein
VEGGSRFAQKFWKTKFCFVKAGVSPDQYYLFLKQTKIKTESQQEKNWQTNLLLNQTQLKWISLEFSFLNLPESKNLNNFSNQQQTI